MIPEARNVRLKPKIREALEARRRAATTAQRDVRRARIVLLAAQGRSTRSIAEEVGVQPRFVSNWRRRFAEHGLGGLKDRPRGSRKRIYGNATNQRILALLDKPPSAGFARWTGPLLAKMLVCVDVLAARLDLVPQTPTLLRDLHETVLVREITGRCTENPHAHARSADRVAGRSYTAPAHGAALCSRSGHGRLGHE